MSWDIYLVDAAGFFLQIFPCAMLCFLPFDTDKLSVKKRIVYPVITAVTLILAAVFPPALALPGDIPPSRYRLSGDIYILATIAVLVTAYLFLVREHFSKKLLVVYVVIFYAALNYRLSNRIYGLLLPVTGPWYPDLNTIYGLTHVLFYIAAMFTLFPLAALFMRRGMAVFLRDMEPERMRREFLFATLSTISFLILMIVADVTMDEKIYTYIIYFFLLMNQAMIYWLVFIGALNRSREENALRAAHAQKLQYEKIAADMEQAARLRHDIRHHWNYLYAIADTGSREEIKSYLRSLTAQTEHRENEVFCKNFTVNALLQYYIGLAQDNGISCSVAAECGDLDISPEDLTVIIGNVLENAISSCLRADGDRTVDVAVGVLHGAFTLEVVNTCPGVRLSRDYKNTGDFLPAQAFRSARGGSGRGLFSISDLARKYLGSAAFRYDEETRTFTTQVILCRI